MNGNKPSRKVGAGALAASASVILVWLIGLTGVEVPPAISSAFTTLIGFGVSYYVADE